MRKSVLGLAATIVGMLVAPATPTPLPAGGSLRWDAPAGCPGATEVAALVDVHLGGGATEIQPVTADATVTGEADGRWAVSMTLRTGEGAAAERTLTVGSCDAAAQAVALAVALAAAPALAPAADDDDEPDEAPPTVAVPTVPPPAEPAAPEPAQPEPGEPEPAEPQKVGDALPSEEAAAPGTESGEAANVEADPLAEPGTSSSNAAADAAPQRTGIRGFLGAGGGVAGGVLPNPSGFVLVEGGVLGPRWQVALRADYVVQRRTRLDLRPGAGGLLSSFGGGALAGPWFEVGPLELPLLAGVVAGAFRAEGFGSSSNETRSRLWVAALVDAGVRWAPLPRLAIDLRAELVVPFVRHTFTLGDPFVVARTGTVGGRGFATVALRLP